VTPFTIAVHGGAGPAAADDDAQASMQGCRRAARAGFEVLKAGGSALDAVCAAAVVLEDDPIFNAGIGSCLNADGEVEMDASVMAGDGLRAGAVGAVRTVKNPVLLARAVMEKTSHVLLCAEGAQRFANEIGIPHIDPKELITERQVKRLAAHQQSGGTIGAVARDARGHLAAATSTGGMTGKRGGRLGDTPIIGAGTYADDEGGAASATGHGEVIIRAVMSKVAIDALRAGASAGRAASEALEAVKRVGGEAGIIVVDRLGATGFAFNTARMSRPWLDSAGGEGQGFGP